MSKTLLIIPHTYPDDTNPNITPFIKEHSVALCKAGYRVIILHVKILAMKKWKNGSETKIQKHFEDGIIRYCVSVRFVKGFERLNTLKYCKQLERLFEYYMKQNGSADLLISHFYQYAGIAASKISKKHNIPWIAIEHAGWLLKEKIPAYEKKKLSRVCESADRIICVSKELEKCIRMHVETNVINCSVIPNMIEDRFVFVPRKQKTDVVFFSAGNLLVGKRFDLLIKAFCSAFTKDENVKLRIAGAGNQYEKLSSLIHENDRTSQISLLGSLTKSEMMNEYINCDCFALPSEHETFGIVYREALAVGRPIITTDHQGFRNDSWNDKYGVRIDIDNINQLVDALIYMKNNIGIFNIEELSDECRRTYSTSRIIEEYQTIINNLVG